MTAALGQKAKSHQSLSPSLATRDEQCQHTPQIRCSGAQTLLQRRSRCDGRGELSEAVACARANDAGCICIMLTNKHCHASINARALRPPALTDTQRRCRRERCPLTPDRSCIPGAAWDPSEHALPSMAVPGLLRPHPAQQPIDRKVRSPVPRAMIRHGANWCATCLTGCKHENWCVACLTGWLSLSRHSPCTPGNLVWGTPCPWQSRVGHPTPCP